MLVFWLHNIVHQILLQHLCMYVLAVAKCCPILTHHALYFLQWRMKNTLQPLKAQLLAEVGVAENFGSQCRDFPLFHRKQLLQSFMKTIICLTFLIY